MYAQLLIAVSFGIASYQDFKERAVHDLVWIPGIIGAAYSIYWAYPSFEVPLVKLAAVGGIALVFTVLGLVGQADAIGLALIAADPFRFSPIFPLFGSAIVAMVHIGYEFAVGNARGTTTIPLEKFLKEQRWIPKAIIEGGTRTEVSKDVNNAREDVEANGKPGASVEVSYGVPTVSYLGIGYAAFLIFLAVTNFNTFTNLP